MSARAHLHEAIQATAAMDEDLEGAVLVGWVAVAEWMSPDGKRWLSEVSADASGESCTSWQRQGYLFSALHEGFGGPGEDDDADSS